MGVMGPMILLGLVLLTDFTQSSREGITDFQDYQSSGGHFRHLVWNSDTQHLYVGGMDKVYDLGSDLRKIHQTITGPKLDSDSCPPGPPTAGETCTRMTTNNYNQALIIDVHNSLLIACGTVYYGSCTKIRITDFTEMEMVYNPVVPNAEQVPVVAFIAPGISRGGNNLYVGATRSSKGNAQFLDDVPMLSSRKLDSFEIANIETTGSSSIDIRVSSRQNFQVYYKFGMNDEDSAIFLTVQKANTSAKNYVTHVQRVCLDDYKFESYIEVPLKCNIHGREYNVLTAAYVSKAGKDLAAKMGVVEGADILFAVFSVSQRDSPIPTSMSALCVYTMDRVRSLLFNNYRACYGGSDRARIGPGHIHTPGPCRKTNIGDTPNFCSGEHVNHPVEGLNEIIHQHYMLLDNHMITSIAVKAFGIYTMAFMGTDDGHLLKTILTGRNHGYIYKDVSVDHGSPLLKDTVFDNAKEHLYIMTKMRVYKVKLSFCDKFTTCDTCIGEDDPHCGWCSGPNKCVSQAECSEGNTWMSYKDVCPKIESITPTTMAVNMPTSIRVKLMEIPRSSTNILCSFSVGGGHEVQSVGTMFEHVKTVECAAPDSLPDLPAQEVSANATLSLDINDNPWVTGTIVLFDCGKHTSCTNCTSNQWPCVWCVEDGMCIVNSSKCSKHMLVIAGSNVYAASDAILNSGQPYAFEGPKDCPRIEAESSYISPSGVEKNYSIIGRKMMLWKVADEYETKGVKCVFREPDTGIVIYRNASVTAIGSAGQTLGDGHITCQPVKLEFSSDDPFIRYTLDVAWEFGVNLDNPHLLNVEVYRCRNMVLNCGNCLTIDSIYKCGWCQSSEECSLHTDCATNDWLWANATCPNPKIYSFHPSSGPVNGGTKVTIQGENLGRHPGEIKDGVKFDDILCSIQLEHYDAADSFVCLTHASETAKTVPISVTVNNKFTAHSTKMFSFVEPEFEGFSPTRGPVYGHTHVTITGSNLNIGNSVTVFVGDQRANVSRSTSTELVFEAPPTEQPGLVPIRVHIDGSEEHLTGSYDYTPMPKVNNMQFRNTLRSGGSVLNVTGENFVSVQSAALLFLLDGWIPKGNCAIHSDTVMQCSTPNLLDGEYTTSETMPIDYSFQLDHFVILDKSVLVTTMSPPYSQMEIYPDPIIKQWEKKKEYASDEQNAIWGENLQNLEHCGNYKILVGLSPSTVERILVDRIQFTPPSNPNGTTKEGLAPVTIIQGNFRVKVGSLQYPVATADLNLFIIIGASVGGFGLVLLIILLVCLCRRSKKKKQANKKQAPPLAMVDMQARQSERNRYVDSGTSRETQPLATERGEEEDGLGEMNCKVDDTYIRGLLSRIESNRLRNAVAEVLISRERLELGEMIGNGNYGCVYKAVLKEEQGDNGNEVAVKTLQGDEFDALTTQAFLKEGVFMRKFDHQHVLRLLGVCVNQQEEPMIITPYMSKGDLRSYVKDKSQSFTARQLLQLAQQVAEGMAYLASLSFIHRDLAARNCMIDDQDVVKVADFGLSKNLLDKEYFSIKERRAKLPVKWMALESLEDFTFTAKSDVWSFGVLLWELMTRGVTPYPDVDVFSLRDYLAAGRRLRKPKFCPDEIYRIMTLCWDSIPERRPPFADLVNRIELLLNPQRSRPAEPAEPMYINIGETDSADYLNPISPNTTAAGSNITDVTTA